MKKNIQIQKNSGIGGDNVGRDKIIINKPNYQQQKKKLIKQSMFNKKLIFISYNNKERLLAERLHYWFQQIFGDFVDIFLDKKNISSGENWLELIENALDSAIMLCVIAGPNSLQERWINLEIGLFWKSKKPISFLCHSGLMPDNLEMPYKMSQSNDLSDYSSFKELIYDISKKHLQIHLPPLDFITIHKDIEFTIKSINKDC